MGAAVLWEIVYFYWHEKHKLIPRYRTKIPFMVRFVDDFFGLALVGGENGLSKNEWSQFKDDISDFDILTWQVGES